MQTKKKKREKSKSLFLEQRVFWISDSERRTLELFFFFFYEISLHLERTSALTFFTLLPLTPTAVCMCMYVTHTFASFTRPIEPFPSANCLNPIPCNRSRGVESVRLAGALPFRADNAARLAERHPTPPVRTRLTQQAAT